MRVEEILASKGSEVMTIRSDATVDSAMHRLRLENVGALVVSDGGLAADGIISERDIVRGFAEHGCEALNMSVRALMTRHVHTCSPDSKLPDVMSAMTRYRIRHVPVVDDGRLVGIVSIGDIVKHRLEELELEANILRDRVITSR